LTNACKRVHRQAHALPSGVAPFLRFLIRGPGRIRVRGDRM